LTAEARRSGLIEAARLEILDQGYLPVSMASLARRAGVSKALVYAHFPDPHDLYGAVIEAELDDLAARGLAEAAAVPDLAEAACAAAEVYRDHVGRRGPILHVIYRDPYMRGGLPDRARRLRDRVLGGFARRLRGRFGLDARAAAAATNLILTVPEEAGRLVWQRAVSAEASRASCRELVLGCLESLGG
jgi:AcrR family transcriptional regulator